MSHRTSVPLPSLSTCAAFDEGTWLQERITFFLAAARDYLALYGTHPSVSVWYADPFLPPTIEACALRTSAERRQFLRACQQRIRQGLAGVVLVFIADLCERETLLATPHLMLHGACPTGEQLCAVPLERERTAAGPRFRMREQELPTPLPTTDTLLSELVWQPYPRPKGH